jgi:hypothetical protein
MEPVKLVCLFLLFLLSWCREVYAQQAVKAAADVIDGVSMIDNDLVTYGGRLNFNVAWTIRVKRR